LPKNTSPSHKIICTPETSSGQTRHYTILSICELDLVFFLSRLAALLTPQAAPEHGGSKRTDRWPPISAVHASLGRRPPRGSVRKLGMPELAEGQLGMPELEEAGQLGPPPGGEEAHSGGGGSLVHCSSSICKQRMLYQNGSNLAITHDEN
jgi:hypothetical protein